MIAQDSLDRLTNSQRGALNANKDGISGTAAREEGFTLDDVGNWSAYVAKTAGTTDLSQTRTHDLANELVAFGQDAGQPHWADPNLDAAGNMVGVPKPSDMTGKYTCVYDAWNRLVAVREASDNSPVAAYRYDGLNRRIRKVVASPSATYDHYYDASWRLLEVRKDGSSLPYEQYVWSERYIDSPVLRDRNADPNASTGDLGKSASGLDERLYYLTDAQMNVTALLDGTPGSGTLGAAVERYAYDPYGKVTVYDGTWTNTQSAAVYANEVLYCGYRLDTETGLYDVRNRVYHPLLGRWAQRDPLGYVDGLGVYEYCSSLRGTPLDPLGLGLWDHVCGFFSGVADVAVGAVKFVKDTLVGGAETVELAYGAAKWAVTGDPTTLANTTTTDYRAAPGWKPDFAKKTEDTYKETGSVLLAVAEGTLEGGKAVPIIGTGIRAGENLHDAIDKGRWDVSNTRRLGQTGGEIVLIEAVRRATTPKTNTLYRGVDRFELGDIRDFKGFRPRSGGEGYETGKWFTENPNATSQYGPFRVRGYASDSTLEGCRAYMRNHQINLSDPYGGQAVYVPSALLPSVSVSPPSGFLLVPGLGYRYPSSGELGYGLYPGAGGGRLGQDILILCQFMTSRRK